MLDVTEKYVGSDEILAYFRMTRGTLELLIRRGLPHIKLGRNRRYKLSEVEAWLKQKTK